MILSAIEYGRQFDINCGSLFGGKLNGRFYRVMSGIVNMRGEFFPSPFQEDRIYVMPRYELPLWPVPIVSIGSLNVSPVPPVPISRRKTACNIRAVENFLWQTIEHAKRKPELWQFERLWKVWAMARPGDKESFGQAVNTACKTLEIETPPGTPKYRPKNDYDLDGI